MIYDFRREALKRGLKWKIAVSAVVLFIVIAAVIASSIYLQIIQLNEIGRNLSKVYTTNLFYKIVFAAATFVVIFLIIGLTNIFIKRNIRGYLRENGLEQRKLPNFLIAGAIALIGAFITKDFFYQKALEFLNSEKFGINTPLFGNLDVGYYVFQRPFLMSFYQFISALWLFVIFYTAAYYLIMLVSIYSTLTWENLKVKTILRHNLVNIAIFFLIKAFSYEFQKEGIVYSTFANVTGAGYVDVNVWKRYFEIAPFLLVLIVIVSFIFIWRGRLKLTAATIAVFPVVWLVVLMIAAVTQQFIVKPNEFNYEKQYLKNNMKETRQAYNIDNITSHSFSGMSDLTPDIINKNSDTIKNIRVVDFEATLDSDKQLQSNTNFYTFNNGDIINYNINGKEIPVFITAREIDKSRIPQLTYINNTFKYTHGYGVVINPINQLSPEGQVQFILSDLKGTSKDSRLKVSEPRIYYGEMTNDHVIINPPDSGKEREIDYDGTDGMVTSYNGQGGIKLNMFNRLLFAMKYSDLNMLISGNISSDSKLLLNRQIVERAQKAVPFLRVDDDPYIIIDNNGRLKWVMDAYTTTSRYPYSQSYGDYNYIRNSVKIVIDAYDGKVKYYAIDKNDPIIKVYSKIYPGVISKDPLPADIVSHMRYPEELFKLQTEVMKKYHLDPEGSKESVSMFYTNQDLWNIARFPEKGNSDSFTDIEPYYNMIKLPEGIGSTEELILMRPFTPSGEKHNMVSWLAVRNNFGDGGKDYGQLILFNFPKNTNILGPDQVEVNINQIGEISESMTLWGQSGSEVFKGNLLVIPIDNSVLYVEPVYIKSKSTSSIPQVRKIVVGFQKGDDFKYGIGKDLDSALQSLFKSLGQPGTAAPSTSVVPTSTATPEVPGNGSQQAGSTNQVTDKEKVISDITAKYDEMKKQLEELGKLIDQLKN